MQLFSLAQFVVHRVVWCCTTIQSNPLTCLVCWVRLSHSISQSASQPAKLLVCRIISTHFIFFFFWESAIALNILSYGLLGCGFWLNISNSFIQIFSQVMMTLFSILQLPMCMVGLYSFEHTIKMHIFLLLLLLELVWQCGGL